MNEFNEGRTVKYSIVLIGSTGGGVLNKLLAHPFVSESVREVVSDRACGFLSVAEKFGIASVLLAAETGHEFSLKLSERYRSEQNVIFISFYTRLFSAAILQQHPGRFFNCHPSILPAFKGMNGFGETLSSSALFMGCTLHQVDSGIDSGKCIIQAAIPVDRTLPEQQNRHKIFLAQYYSTLQFIKWIAEERITLAEDELMRVRGLAYSPAIFSPNLDADFFTVTGLSDELHVKPGAKQ